MFNSYVKLPEDMAFQPGLILDTAKASAKAQPSIPIPPGDVAAQPPQLGGDW